MFRRCGWSGGSALRLRKRRAPARTDRRDVRSAV